MILEYINYLRQVRGLSARTCQEYQKALKEFVSWAKPLELRWSTITKQDGDKYTMDMSAKGLQAATIKMRMSILRSMFNWMQREGMIIGNPMKYAQSPRLGEKLPEAVELAAVDEYLNNEAIDQHDKMTHIFVALCVDTGLRIQEALDLTKDDFDFRQRTIKVKGKGNKERIVYFTARTTNQLVKYAPRTWTTSKLFHYDQRTMREFVAIFLGRYIPMVHPHQLRHTFATECLNRGMRLEEVSKLLGHSSTKITERYAKLSNNNLKNSYHEHYGN